MGIVMHHGFVLRLPRDPDRGGDSAMTEEDIRRIVREEIVGAYVPFATVGDCLEGEVADRPVTPAGLQAAIDAALPSGGGGITEEQVRSIVRAMLVPGGGTSFEVLESGSLMISSHMVGDLRRGQKALAERCDGIQNQIDAMPGAAEAVAECDRESPRFERVIMMAARKSIRRLRDRGGSDDNLTEETVRAVLVDELKESIRKFCPEYVVSEAVIGMARERRGVSEFWGGFLSCAIPLLIGFAGGVTLLWWLA